MKRPLCLLPMLLLGAAAHATPTHLVCKDADATRNGIRDERLYEHPIFVDTSTNTAKRWGAENQLRILPNELILSRRTEKKTRYIDQWTYYVFKINRTTLKFNAEHTIGTNGNMAKILREGQCEIAPTPAERKI